MKVTRRQLNLIIENYLNEADKLGIGSSVSFDFKNSCDFSDIEMTKGFKAIQEFRKNRNVQATSKKIRELEAAINNPEVAPGASPDDYVAGKITELEFEKKKLTGFTEEIMGPFGFDKLAGITSPMFQSQLIQILGFGMMLTLGPAANLYCNLIRSVVSVLNKSIEAYTDVKDKKEEYETIEFDFFYNALERVASPVFRSLAKDQEEDVWNAMLDELNLSPNALALFKYIYCVIGGKSSIDTSGISSTSRSTSAYRNEVKTVARKLLSNIKTKKYTIEGFAPVRSSTSTTPAAITLKSEFQNIINAKPKRDKLIKDLVSFIDPFNKYDARGKVRRSNFTELSQLIADKSAKEEEFYDNLLGHIKGTLNSVPG